MKLYKDWRPSPHDAKGLGLPERQDWFVVEVFQNRDSDVLARSNFTCAWKDINRADDGDIASGELGSEEPTAEVHRFGHWGNGWFEVILVKPGSKAYDAAERIEAALANYPVLSEDDMRELAEEEATQAWRHMRAKERLEYIRKHKSDFALGNWRNLLAQVRGEYFGGDAVDFLNQH